MYKFLLNLLKYYKLILKFCKVSAVEISELAVAGRGACLGYVYVERDALICVPFLLVWNRREHD